MKKAERDKRLADIEKPYFDRDGVERTLDQMVRLEPEWTAARFRVMLDLIALAAEVVKAWHEWREHGGNFPSGEWLNAMDELDQALKAKAGK